MQLSHNISAINALLTDLGIDLHTAPINATMVGDDPIIHSVHKLGTAGAVCQLLMAILAGKIWQDKTDNSRLDLAITAENALHSIHETQFIRQNGYPIDVGAENVAVNHLFRCADDQFVMLEAGPPYNHLLSGYLDFFNCPNNRVAIAQRVRTYQSEDLERQLNALGLPCCRAFTSEEWRQTTQGQLLAAQPAIELTKLAAGRPVPFSSADEAPLTGIHVFDFTHVLAGPYSSRSLAGYGAHVLHVSSPYHADTLAQHLGVDIDKQMAYLNLDQPADRDTQKRLLQDADVVISSYRDRVNQKFGLWHAANHPRGQIQVEISAYGSEGPWKGRGGFDQNGQVVAGFARNEGTPQTPKFSPVFYLNDLLTAHLATIGVLAALLRRSTEGGSYRVRVNLARTAMWVESLGLLEPKQLHGLPKTDVAPLDNLETHGTTYGKLTYPGPFVTGTDRFRCHHDFIHPYGADQATWDCQ